MTPVGEPLLLLARVVLAALALYHLATGVLALAAPRRAYAAMRRLYAAELAATPQLDYATMMIGAQAIAIGALAAVAARAPLEHRAVVAALALLQLLRATVRVARARMLRDALGVPARRNAVATLVLIAEVAVLVAFLAAVR